MGQPVELIMNQRQQRFECSFIALTPFPQ